MKQFIPILILSVLTSMIIAGAAGYLIAPRSAIQKSDDQMVINEDDLFDSQSATINGRITEINDNKITIVNQEKESGTFELFTPVFISKVSGNKVASPSSDIRQIEIDKSALISLQKTNKAFQVVSITYIPNTPEVIPAPPITPNPTAE